jgi:transketolase
VIKKGSDISIISIGSITEIALTAADFLDRAGISTEVVSMHSLKPIDKNLILKILKEKKAVFTLEEHTILGGLGSAVAEIISESAFNKPFKRIGVRDEYPKVVGKQDFLRELVGISPNDVVKIVEEIYLNKTAVVN